MKKILMILCFILLCGCQQNEIGTDHKTNIQKKYLAMKIGDINIGDEKFQRFLVRIR